MLCVFVVLKILGEEKVSGANRYAMTCNIDNISLTNVFTILQISCLQTNTQTRFANKKDIHIDGKKISWKIKILQSSFLEPHYNRLLIARNNRHARNKYRRQVNRVLKKQICLNWLRLNCFAVKPHQYKALEFIRLIRISPSPWWYTRLYTCTQKHAVKRFAVNQFSTVFVN